ncbi:UNVERIFIED_ORG: hypothetical protein [Escherichia phage CMSTMSU]
MYTCTNFSVVYDGNETIAVSGSPTYVPRALPLIDGLQFHYPSNTMPVLDAGFSFD